MFLVANIPPVHCWIRKEFLYDFKEGKELDGWVRGKMDGYQGGTGALKKGKTYEKNAS